MFSAVCTVHRIWDGTRRHRLSRTASSSSLRVKRCVAGRKRAQELLIQADAASTRESEFVNGDARGHCGYSGRSGYGAIVDVEQMAACIGYSMTGGQRWHHGTRYLA